VKNNEKRQRTYVTKTGRVLEDSDVRAIADEVETRYYDVEAIRRRPGRPRLGAEPGEVVAVRLEPKLRARLEELARLRGSSTSDVVRSALNGYLSHPPKDGFATKTGRTVTDAEIRRMSSDVAEQDYDPSDLLSRGSLSKPARGELITVRLERTLRGGLEGRAVQESVSRSDVIRRALQEHLSGDEPRPTSNGSPSPTANFQRVSTPDATILATDCFISYRRDDNAAFDGVVDQLKNALEHVYTAHTGKVLRIFLDRESIGWGEDWRQRIRESVERATALIPIVTMRYFTSPACCDELVTFHANALQLGVPELILPIVVAGSDQIRADDPRPEVQLIERLNYKNLQKPWLAGYDSPEWRRAMLDVVTSLDKALVNAEDRLTVRERESLGTIDDKASWDTSSGSVVVPEADLTEFTTRIEGMGDRVEETLKRANSFMSAIGDVLNAEDVQSLSPSQQQARLVREAGRIGPIAKTLGTEAAALLADARESDALLRALIDELSGLGMTELHAVISSSLNLPHDANQIAPQMNQVISAVKAFGLLNVSLRRAIAPGIQGLEAMQSAVQIFLSWQNISPPDS